MEGAREKRDFCVKMMKDSQHEVLLPAGQVAPYSDGRALHILYFESHISVELLCKLERDEERAELQANTYAKEDNNNATAVTNAHSWEEKTFSPFFLSMATACNVSAVCLNIYIAEQQVSPPSVIHLFLFPGSQVLTLGSIQLGFLHC